MNGRYSANSKKDMVLTNVFSANSKKDMVLTNVFSNKCCPTTVIDENLGEKAGHIS